MPFGTNNELVIVDDTRELPVQGIISCDAVLATHQGEFMRAIVCCLIATVVASAAVAETENTTAELAPRAQPTPARHPTNDTVFMIGNATGYVFQPAEISVKQGDSITYVMVSGGPHNVAFDPKLVTGAARAALSEGMPDQAATLSGKFLMRAGESYTISFAGVPAGEYVYYCTPHVAMQQFGKVTVVAP